MPVNLVSRHVFGSPVPRQPVYFHTQAESGAYLRDSSRVRRRRHTCIHYNILQYNTNKHTRYSRTGKYALRRIWLARASVIPRHHKPYYGTLPFMKGVITRDLQCSITLLRHCLYLICPPYINIGADEYLFVVVVDDDSHNIQYIVITTENIVVVGVVFHIQRIGCQPEKNYFTRWPIPLVVCRTGEKKKKSGSAPPPPQRAARSEENKIKSRDASSCLGGTRVGVTQVVSVCLASVQGFLRLVS